MTNKTLAISALVIGLVGYASGRYLQPPQIKEVVKTVEVVKHDTTTIIKERKKPDGSSETDTTIINHDTDISSSKDSKVTSILPPQWKVQGQYGYDFRDLRPVYGAAVDRRIIGPIFIGVWGNTNHTAGLSASLEF
jgi:hypothetical protein